MPLYKSRCLNPDTYALSQMSMYVNKKIGGISGVGYTAVTGAIRRVAHCLKKNKRTAKQVGKIIGRGRNAGCPAPPAQIPACAANAQGSCLGY